MQALAPSKSEYVPKGQVIHWLDDEWASTKVPPYDKYVPAGQDEQALVPSNSAYLPAGHTIQPFPLDE